MRLQSPNDSSPVGPEPGGGAGRSSVLALVAALALGTSIAGRPVAAQEHPGHGAEVSLPDSGMGPAPSGDPAARAPEAPPPLYDDLGSLHREISTSSPEAQAYFDQGLRLVYAFNHAEAIRAFRQAARLDPKAAMPHWGIALALGPNINLAMDSTAGREAYAEARKALELSRGATPEERSLIRALARRYARDGKGDRAALDLAYADAMRAVARQFPADPDAGTLFAESLLDLRPWDQWTPLGKPRPGTLEGVATLKRVLKDHPDHPGACHYYIHIIEASPHPERALPCAERLASLMPGAGHLVHMPAHLYMRLGMYDKAAEQNVHAAATDERYIADQHPRGTYPLAYYSHNLHFLGAAASMEGRSADAIDAARRLAVNVSFDVAREDPTLELWTSVGYWTLARFGRWDEILREPPPPSDLRFTTAMWRYARGLALAAGGRLSEAAAERDSILAIQRATPTGRIVGSFHKATDLLRIADRVLAANLAQRETEYDEAVRLLEGAVRVQDGLRYDEPPAWYDPVRQTLGYALLAAGRPAEAERVYREDLRRNPGNGWSLYGLAESLEAQGKAREQAETEELFRKAWARADVQLSGSVFF